MLGLGDDDEDICSGVQSSKVSHAGPINDDEINLCLFVKNIYNVIFQSFNFWWKTFSELSA